MNSADQKTFGSANVGKKTLILKFKLHELHSHLITQVAAATSHVQRRPDQGRANLVHICTAFDE